MTVQTVGSGGTTVIGLMPNVQFVSPTGDNSNSGETPYVAKLDITSAYNALSTGGTIYIADGSAVGGNGCLWFAESYLPSDWLPAKPVRFVGYGTTSNGQFSESQVGVYLGSSSDRTQPGIWVARVSHSPITFENILIAGYPQCPIRLGWDYERNSSSPYGIVTHTVASANRVSGVTTLTFPGAVPSLLTVGTTFLFQSLVPSTFQVTSYKVTAVNTAANQITYDDPGYSDDSASSPGVIVVEDRSRSQNAVFTEFVNCSAVANNNESSDGGKGPAVDMGATFWIYFNNCMIFGYPPADTFNPDRSAAMLLYSPVAGASAVVRNVKSAGGGIRIYGADQSWGLYVDEFYQDAPITRPAVEVIDNNPAGQVLLRYLQNNDQGEDPMPTVRIDGTARVVSVDQGQWVDGPATVLSGPSETWWSNVLTKSPWQMLQTGFWGPGRVAGVHPGIARSTSPTVARYQNLIGPPSGWWSSAATVSAVDAPDGSVTATRVSTTATNAQLFMFDTNMTISVGDTFFLGCWVRPVSGNLVNPIGFNEIGAISVNPGSVSDLHVFLVPPFVGDGEWQWVFNSYTVTTVSTALEEVRTAFVVDSTHALDLWNPLAFRIPADPTTLAPPLSPNELAEFFGTLKTWPSYLQPGMVGTLAGQMFIAHGGLGVGNAIAPVARTTIVKNIEVFDASGTSLGFIEVKQ